MELFSDCCGTVTRIMLKYLRLLALLDNWNLYLKTASNSNFSMDRLLRYVVQQEYNLKMENSRRMRLQRARIPEQYVIDTFPFQNQPRLNKIKLVAIYDSFEYVEQAQNIIWIGPSGTGKSGLATSFLIQAINKEKMAIL